VAPRRGADEELGMIGNYAAFAMRCAISVSVYALATYVGRLF
jgi:hypothetical protein